MTSIPEFDEHGHLPAGVHDCTLSEIGPRFGWNDRRENLVDGLVKCVQNEIRPRFQEPVIVDGSFVTDKLEPGDVDIVLDLQDAPIDVILRGVDFGQTNKERIDSKYGVDFWVQIPGVTQDFSKFFQYLGDKRAEHTNLDSKILKGVLRVI